MSVTRILRILLVVAVLLAAPAAAQAGMRSKMLHATNHSRARFGLARVDLDREPSLIALIHSRAMDRHGGIYHTKHPAQVYLAGMRWRYWGENVGVTDGTVADLEHAFMASTDHRRNILNPAFRHVAIGVVWIRGVLWVTVFFWG
jgi:uncharacterized protein YkwD